jgi:superfamily II DNA or RNA helicase
MPRRGILSWLREWAEGTDMHSAAQALVFVLAHPTIEGIRSAKIIPTTAGLRALSDKGELFLRKVDDVEIEGACFVLPQFLAISGIEQNLRERGIRDLDPFSILQARLESLRVQSDDAALSLFWDAVDGVPVATASRLLAGDRTGRVRVPTRDGGWAAPSQVFDIDGIGDELPHRMLDRQRCRREVAHSAGVVHAPVHKFSLEDEDSFEDYREFALDDINRRLGPGEHRVEQIEFDLSEGAGPFSVLLMLEKAGAPEPLRARWTSDLVLLDAKEYWLCEDVDTRLSYRVVTPVRWAVREAGLLESARGHRAPTRTVSASLIEFDGLLPLFRGQSAVEEKLGLPRELEEVPVEVMREALETKPESTRIRAETLTKFILVAGRISYPDERPPLIPAYVGRGIEVKRPGSVYLATDDEQVRFLSDRHKPYLRVDGTQVREFMDSIGCRRFEDSFSFSLMHEGEQEPERVIDLYIGLRKTFAADKIVNATVVKAARIAKRVTTEDGVEDQPLEWHLDGLTLLVNADLDQRRILEIINKAFELRLTNADLNEVEQAGVDHQLELVRQEALAASDDVARLEVYFGDDTLKEALPRGLWPALEHQGLVDAETSVAKLYLTVNGTDSIRLLAKQFEAEGFDIPTEWAGRNPTIAWLRKMGFGAEYAGQPRSIQEQEFVVPGAVKLKPLHDFQKRIRRSLLDVLLFPEPDGRHKKCMVELPTGAGKTRVASETVLGLFSSDDLSGTVLWIAQSAELCEQAVQTFATVWRALGDERPLTIGRLWDRNDVHRPNTEFGVIIATDAKLHAVLGSPDYSWLRDATAVFIDEAHRAGDSKRYTALLRWLGIDGHSWERPLVGLSATPFKGRFGDGDATKDLAARFGQRRITAFDGNAYEELVGRGVLAQVERAVLDGIDVEMNATEIEKVRSLRKLEQGVLDRIGTDQARMKILVDHIMKQDPTWPVLVFTPSVLSAQILAATLRYQNIEARAVSGETGPKERRDTIEGFKRGEIRVLANCDLLVQGFDAPGVRALYIARPTFSPSAYIQMAGRGLRGPENGGKSECLIVDVADNFGAVNDFLGFRAYESLWGERTS